MVPIRAVAFPCAASDGGTRVKIPLNQSLSVALEGLRAYARIRKSESVFDALLVF